MINYHNIVIFGNLYGYSNNLYRLDKYGKVLNIYGSSIERFRKNKYFDINVIGLIGDFVYG